MKVCQSCKLNKPLDQFWKNRASFDGLKSTCKECSKKAQRDYYRNTLKYKRELLKKYPPQISPTDLLEISIDDQFNKYLEEELFIGTRK